MYGFADVLEDLGTRKVGMAGNRAHEELMSEIAERQAEEEATDPASQTGLQCDARTGWVRLPNILTVRRRSLAAGTHSTMMIRWRPGYCARLVMARPRESRVFLPVR